jgi:hypothetical protein
MNAHEHDWHPTGGGALECACGKSRTATPEKKAKTMPEHIRGSVGRSFQIGSTALYAGPREALPNNRHLKLRPVVAFARPGDEKPTIVGEFTSSTAAEKFIEALMTGIAEATTIPITTQKES